MPPMNPISDLFGKSPFKPLQAHARQVTKAPTEVIKLMEAIIRDDATALAESVDRINKIENKADEIKYEIFEHLPKSIFMPVDRRDLLDILVAQDQIADIAQDIGGLVSLRPLDVPVSMKEGALTLVKRCAEACELSSKIVHELDELIEVGFRGRPVEEVNGMVARLSHVETDTDRLAMDLLRELFAREDEFKPITVVFWHQLIRSIGGLADSAENVGNRLRLLIAR